MDHVDLGTEGTLLPVAVILDFPFLWKFKKPKLLLCKNVREMGIGFKQNKWKENVYIPMCTDVNLPMRAKGRHSSYWMVEHLGHFILLGSY